MPKNRKRVIQKGAKSISVHTSFKIGGRKANRSAHTMSNDELEKAIANCRKRDRNKLRRIWTTRGLDHVSIV